MGNGGHPLAPRAGGANWLTALVVAVVLVVAACSDDDGQSASSTSSTTSSSPATTSTTTLTTTTPETTDGADTLEQELIDRYTTFWDVRFEANQAPPNPDDPRLAEYATGAQLENVRAETTSRRDEGLAVREAADPVTSHDVTVVDVSGDEASLQDCFVNDAVVYRIDSGEVVDDSVVTRSVAVVMVKVEGAWKLESATVIQEWEGVAGCALDSSQ